MIGWLLPACVCSSDFGVLVDRLGASYQVLRSVPSCKSFAGEDRVPKKRYIYAQHQMHSEDIDPENNVTIRTAVIFCTTAPAVTHVSGAEIPL